MWEERFVDDSHGQKRPIILLHPENEADLEVLRKMQIAGELKMSRGDDDRYHVKIEPGKWVWLGDAGQVDAGYADLMTTLNALRPGAMEVMPALFFLPRFYGEVVGEKGVAEIADQARLALGDEILMDALSDPARVLVGTLATLDIPEAMTAVDETAPGQFGGKP